MFSSSFSFIFLHSVVPRSMHEWDRRIFPFFFPRVSLNVCPHQLLLRKLKICNKKRNKQTVKPIHNVIFDWFCVQYFLACSWWHDWFFFFKYSFCLFMYVRGVLKSSWPLPNIWPNTQNIRHFLTTSWSSWELFSTSYICLTIDSISTDLEWFLCWKCKKKKMLIFTVHLKVGACYRV